MFPLHSSLASFSKPVNVPHVNRRGALHVIHALSFLLTSQVNIQHTVGVDMLLMGTRPLITKTFPQIAFCAFYRQALSVNVPFSLPVLVWPFKNNLSESLYASFNISQAYEASGLEIQSEKNVFEMDPDEAWYIFDTEFYDATV